MKTIERHGLTWKWNEALTVNVYDGEFNFYCYTLGDSTWSDFARSIDTVLPFVKESLGVMIDSTGHYPLP